ncbi:ABC transporter substrate-binding protein [Massiliimalia massiliensis]|uniref:ABC transporter substrate-binding protein n=1 Tax=Massiliimalia massiliensis TaxID=1852384 RepID=UPI0013562DC6|nr:sugar ABC transporter substrate-binding protein [Massiliimalia massiliensis]
MKKKHFISILAALMASSMLFTACGTTTTPDGDSSESGGSEAKTGEPVTIRYMTWEDGDWQTFSEEFIDKYMKDNPNVTIQYEPTAGDGYMTKLKTSLSSGTAPDVAWVDGWQEMFKMDVFEPLDDYIAKYNFDLDVQNPALIESGSYNGKIYGLFGWAGVTGIYYNKQLFDDAGVAYPQEGWTWDDCKNIATQMTKGDGADKVYGIDIQLDWSGQYETMMWGNGARIIDDDLNYDGVMNSDKMVEALDWYTSFVKDGVSPQSTSLKAAGGGDEMFKSGQLAMHYAFSGFVQSLEAGGTFDMDNLGVVGLPVANKGDKPAVNVTFTNPLCISKDSKNKDEAFKFVAARVGEETARDFCSRGWSVPGTTALVEELKLMDDPLLKVFADPILNTDKYVYPKPAGTYSPVASALNDAMVNAISAVVVEGKDSKQALDEAVEAVKKAE